MKITRLCVCALSLVLISDTAAAQRGTAMTFDTGGFSGADGDLSTEIASFGLHATGSTALGQRTVLHHRAGYRHVDQDIGKARAGSSGDGVLHSHEYSYLLAVEHALSSRWTIEAATAQHLQSRMQHSPGDAAFYWTGSVAGMTSLSPSLRIGGGIAYARTLGRPLPLPIVVARWQTERFELDISLPEMAAAWWTPHPRVSIGVTGLIDGNQYRTGGLESLGIDDGYIRYRNAAAGPALRLRIAETMILRAEGGTALERSLRVVSSDREIDLAPGTGIYFRVGFSAGIR